LFLDNKVFAFSNLAALINYCATFAVTFLLSLYLQHIKMLTPSQTGIVLVAAPFVQALFSPLPEDFPTALSRRLSLPSAWP
jgi:hypothetical protein